MGSRDDPDSLLPRINKAECMKRYLHLLIIGLASFGCGREPSPLLNQASRMTIPNSRIILRHPGELKVVASEAGERTETFYSATTGRSSMLVKVLEFPKEAGLDQAFLAQASPIVLEELKRRARAEEALSLQAGTASPVSVGNPFGPDAPGFLARGSGTTKTLGKIAWGLLGTYDRRQGVWVLLITKDSPEANAEIENVLLNTCIWAKSSLN